MGTILKYIFYIALIIIIYLVGKGIFEGSINETTTVGQVVDDVKSGAADMAADVADTTKKAVEDTKAVNDVLAKAVEEASQAETATDIRFNNVSFTVEEGPSLNIRQCKDIFLNDVRTKQPIAGQPVVDLEAIENLSIIHCDSTQIVGK